MTLFFIPNMYTSSFLEQRNAYFFFFTKKNYHVKYKMVNVFLR